jgi:hypothetical protein
VLLDSPADWPEGRRLVVIEERPPDVDFMSEEEQSDEPEAVKHWIEDIRALPAVALSAACIFRGRHTSLFIPQRSSRIDSACAPR